MFNKSLPSNMTHDFSNVPRADIPRSAFKRTFTHKTTFDAGYLVPVMVDEILPSSTINLNCQMLARLATPIKPIMDNMFMDIHSFFVPNRLLWNNWERFNGAKDNPDDSTDFLIPQIVAPAVTGWTYGSLADYFGIPTGVASLSTSALWHRAYNLIFREWYRDQNLQDSPVVDLDDGPDTATDYVLLRRGKRHDYFTSCLPFPQKGPGVEIPLGNRAPIIGIGLGTGINWATNHDVYETENSTAVNYPFWQNSSSVYIRGSAAGQTPPSIYADLSDATASTINSLREAFQLQRLYERDSLGGTRYVELLKSHFGAQSPDFRLQRPELLASSTVPVVINPIAQNNATGATGTPQGNLAGVGTAVGGHSWSKSFVEHGVILTLVSVRADLTYQQGLHRMFSRRERFDFYYPALAHLGEQSVFSKEIFCDGTAGDEDIFGYQERWAEYRYKPSQITGLFRSTHSTPLDTWHLSQEFGSRPVLNSDFIEENPPVDRVIAVPSEPHFIFDSFWRINTVLPMPTYSVPGFIDHF